MRGLHICFFYEGLRPGGVEHMICNLSHELLARGHRLTMVLAGSPTARDHVPAPGVTVHWLNHPTKSARGSIPALVSVLRGERPDVLLSAMPAFNNAAVVARALARVATRVVVTERSDPVALLATERWTQRAWHRAACWLYPRADAIVVVSAGLAEALARFAHLPGARIELIHNPAYAPAAHDDAAAHPWTRDGKGPVIVAAGRLSPEKDFATLLRAMALVRRKRADVRALILGDGSERGRLEALRAELGLADAVAMPGFVQDIVPTLSAAGHFVLSSTSEGFGNVLVEALGAGCAIVATDCPHGPREILADGAFGALVPVGGAAAMARAILAMLTHPIARAAQVARAEAFGVAQACDRYEAVFRRVTTR